MTGTVRRQGRVEVPRRFAFDFVSDFGNVSRWMYGVSRFVPRGAQTSGQGARFETSFNGLGGAHTIELEATRWLDERLIVLESVGEPHVNARFGFDAITADATVLDIHIVYPTPAGLGGLALGKVGEFLVRAAVQHVETTLRREVEAAFADHSNTL